MSSSSFEGEGSVSVTRASGRGSKCLRAIGYCRASTEEQQRSGLGLEAQKASIEAACTQRGWRLVAIEEDIASGSRKERPGLSRALAAIEASEADCVVVSRLDRLSRSVAHFASLLERYPRAIVALDLGVDPGSVAGEFTATVVAAAAQMERRLIGARTREALQAARDRGVRLGRPPEIGDDVMGRIRSLQLRGHGVSEIARILNQDGVPTPRGGTWHRASVWRVLSRADAA